MAQGADELRKHIQLLRELSEQAGKSSGDVLKAADALEKLVRAGGVKGGVAFASTSDLEAASSYLAMLDKMPVAFRLVSDSARRAAVSISQVQARMVQSGVGLGAATKTNILGGDQLKVLYLDQNLTY